MVEENVKKEFVPRHPKMVDIARELSDISKERGTVGFFIKYMATDGNLKIHEDFMRFAYDECNTEYLAAIGKLLEYRKLSERINYLETRILALEALVIEHLENGESNGMQKEEEKVVEDKKDIKSIKVF